MVRRSYATTVNSLRLISSAVTEETLARFFARSICWKLAAEDIRREPIEDRKRRLAGLLRFPHDGIALNEHFGGDGAVIFNHACALGCEGTVSKRLGSPYRAGRSDHWLKVKKPARACCETGS